MSGAASLDAAQRHRKQTLALSLMSPLQVNSGTAILRRHWPTFQRGRDAEARQQDPERVFAGKPEALQIALGFGLVFSLASLLRSIKKVKGSVYLLKLTLYLLALLDVLGQIKLLNELLLSGEQILNDCRHLTSVTALRPIAGCLLFFTLIRCFFRPTWRGSRLLGDHFDGPECTRNRGRCQRSSRAASKP
ncbi:hypothetical protein [Bradyrhizobium iriomotense]|uniref:hypothetical protein n=1 Tax=Bradyrhizobium iriomotense TaxID=441950 RepID=UPI0024E1756F|nr:hypothetical protein [Bradyrhizobium iriomotense]